MAKVLAEHRQQRANGTRLVPKPRKGRGSLVDAYEATLRDYLARYPDMTVVRLLEELRARGYPGGYTVLRQRVKQLRTQGRRPPVERFETGPGVQAQMDWATYTIDFTQEGRRKVQLFSYVLGYSRRQYLHFTASQDLETTIREHVRAFEHLGGVAATCLYDNMKVVVARYEDGEPIYNTRFLAFATHYGFRPVACRPRRPQTKGKVERPFLFIEKNLLSGREFRSLEHLNEVTAWWLAEVADVRVHRQTKRRPIDLHAEELPHLIPLPERPYEVAEMVYRTVDAEGFISYGKNRYSVPWQYLGQVLPVRITDEAVIDLQPATGTPGPARPLPADGAAAAEPTAGAPAAPRSGAAARGPARAVRRVGAAGRALPGGPAGRAALWLGPCPEGAGAAGHLSPRGSSGRPGARRALRGLLGEIHRAHPGGAGPAQDLLGPHGGRRTVSPGRTAVRRSDAAATRDGISTPACLRSPTTMTNRRKRRHRPGRPRRTFLRIFASGSWTTPRRSSFPCPPRSSTRRWPVPSRRACPT